jgi:hypothetical protein
MEMVINGSLARERVDVYEFTHTPGKQVNPNTTSIAGRYLFLAYSDHGYHHVVQDWVAK